MSKIPKEIVDKIEQRNKLNEEIETWCKEHLDIHLCGTYITVNYSSRNSSWNRSNLLCDWTWL